MSIDVTRDRTSPQLVGDERQTQSNEDYQTALADHRRCRVLWVPPHLVVAVLMQWHQWVALSLPLLKNLPDDVRVEHTFWNDLHQAIGMVLHSLSFEPVPLGEPFPALLDAQIQQISLYRVHRGPGIVFTDQPTEDEMKAACQAAADRLDQGATHE